MNDERAYLFRHAVVRDAAYNLLPPGQRASLHAWALRGIELLFGAAGSEVADEQRHAIDAVADQLALHARLAGAGFRGDEIRYTLRAAQNATEAYRHDDALRLWARYSEICPPASLPLSLHRAALAEHRLRGADAAEPIMTRALMAARENGDRRYEGIVLSDFAGLAGVRGRYEESCDYCRLALAIHREVDNRWHEGIALAALGAGLATAGDAQAAREAYAEALQIHHEVGNRRGRATVTMNIANLDMLAGLYDQADTGYQAALALMQDLGDQKGLASVTLNRSELLYRLGQLEEAIKAYERAHVYAVASGDRNTAGGAQCGLARALLSAGRESEARAAWALGVKALQDVGNQTSLRWQIEELKQTVPGGAPFDAL
ncbi:MAG: tetratricopeptide repeat protein [Planctomycetes bacterium]|nr:tetratricopeptide repeat protein [Planctomycetota bacterium]